MSNFTAYNEASQFIIENWGEKGKKFSTDGIFWENCSNFTS